MWTCPNSHWPPPTWMWPSFRAARTNSSSAGAKWSCMAPPSPAMNSTFTFLACEALHRTGMQLGYHWLPEEQQWSHYPTSANNFWRKALRRNHQTASRLLCPPTACATLPRQRAKGKHWTPLRHRATTLQSQSRAKVLLQWRGSPTMIRQNKILPLRIHQIVPAPHVCATRQAVRVIEPGTSPTSGSQHPNLPAQPDLVWSQQSPWTHQQLHLDLIQIKRSITCHVFRIFHVKTPRPWKKFSTLAASNVTTFGSIWGAPKTRHAWHPLNHIRFDIWPTHGFLAWFQNFCSAWKHCCTKTVLWSTNSFASHLCSYQPFIHHDSKYI